MTAVSQTYANYLGGMNEQPDELKKPGQLTQADNVIPDPTIGLIRRPGFELIPQSKVDPVERDVQPDPEGTWFEMEFPNNVNDDYIYFGNVRNDGDIVIYNQDGVKQAVRYTENNISVLPHKKYLYNNNKLEVLNDSDEVVQTVDTNSSTNNGYFRHKRDEPLKYCVSKGHVIFTNERELPTLSKAKLPTNEEKTRYYSFVNLKLVDTDNYDYIFKVYGNDQVMETFNYVTEVETTKVDDVVSDYDTDTTLPLQTEGPWSFELGIAGENGIEETCEVEVEFRGQVQQYKSDDGDGYRNEARYSWSTQIINEGKGYEEGQVFQNILPGVAGGPDLVFTFVINEVKTVTEAKGSKVRPEVTGDMGADGILEALQAAFKDNAKIDKSLIVGNGIYLEGNEPFSVSTSEIAVADVMNSQKIKDDVVPMVRINTVGELPVECYAGFRVEVTNSFEDQNNYYLEYVAESQTQNETSVDTKADGYWEEIAKPFEPHAPRDGTLPHMITLAREADQPRFVFIVSPIKYAKRTAGTENDNPTMFRDNVRITSLNYYKNRLFFLTSGGTVISSKAGKIEDLFLDTAINVSVIDPIDVIANNNQRVPIYGSAIVNNGMVLFGDSEQYMLTTNSDILSSETVSVTKVSNYTFDPVSNPIYLGANLGFVSSGVSRFYEMTNLYERGPVDINERSQQIQNVFGQGFNMPVSSREQSMVLVYKSGSFSRNLRVYKYRQESSQESSQTSWVRWQLDQPISYVSMPRDKIYVFLEDGQGSCKIYRMNTINALAGTFDPTQDKRNYTDGYTDTEPGVPYLTRIEFPTIFPLAGEKADVTANLTIHRLKINTGDSGPYKMEIIREGYDDYVIDVEQTPANKYKYDTEPVFEQFQGDASPPKIDTFPVYTRNKNLRLLIKTDYDYPFTLKSLTWEGDYNRPYYKSV